MSMAYVSINKQEELNAPVKRKKYIAKFIF